MIETGMGGKRAGEALEWAYGRFRPDLLLSIGFAGSLCGHLTVGDVLLGVESVQFSCGKLTLPERGFTLDVPEELKGFFRGKGVYTGRIVTVKEPQPKAAVATLFGDIPTVMDMETYVAASFAAEAGVPLLCLRSVSDGLHDEIDYDVAGLADSAGNVRIAKVLGALLKRPALMSSFGHSWRRAALAAQSLGRTLGWFLDLPASALLTGASGCRVGIRGGGEEGGG